jgi:signal transduction histidine kinase
MTCPAAPPSSICDHHTALILSSLRDYIGIHQPVFDDNGNIVDAELVWWNQPYEEIRAHPPVVNQSLLSTYYESHVALDFVQRAWNESSVKQFFELGEDTFDRYRPPEVLVRIEVTWLRIGGLIVEIGSDLSEMTALEMELIAQRQAYTDATREALLNLERSRIGHDLHDSVIQSLFAITLKLQAQKSEPWVVGALHQVISEIRETIFDIQPESQAPLRTRIQRIIEMFSGAWGEEIECNIDVRREVPDDIADDIENVLREALSNAARHAKATHVSVQLTVDQPHVAIQVIDNGIGPAGLKRRKAGTLSLQQRAQSHGGTFAVTESASGGTHLSWKCPLP